MQSFPLKTGHETSNASYGKGVQRPVKGQCQRLPVIAHQARVPAPFQRQLLVEATGGGAFQRVRLKNRNTLGLRKEVAALKEALSKERALHEEALSKEHALREEALSRQHALHDAAMSEIRRQSWMVVILGVVVAMVGLVVLVTMVGAPVS